MTNLFSKIIDKLKKYPEVKYLQNENSINIYPSNENGFNVKLEILNNEIIVSGDNWHEHFNKEDEDQALEAFAFLLSNSCRLKVEYKNNNPISWTMEFLENEKWNTDSTNGKLIYKFWKKSTYVYLQNKIIQV